MKKKYSLKVQGKPIAQPRHRLSRRGFAYIPASHPVHEWKELVREAAAETVDEPFTGPVEVRIDFYMPRPTSKQYKRKPMPSYWHYSKPDIDNLTKAILDALDGLAYINDSQVSILKCSKQVAEGLNTPEALVEISPL